MLENMVEQKFILQNEKERRKVLDDTCFDLFRLMLNTKIQETGIRYNDLFRLAKQLLHISKPTFNDHLQHLKRKKYVLSRREGKQKVLLSLNLEHQAVKSSIEARVELQEDLKRLGALLENKDYLTRLPEMIARTSTINMLNQMRISLSLVTLPENSQKNRV